MCIITLTRRYFILNFRYNGEQGGRHQRWEYLSYFRGELPHDGDVGDTGAGSCSNRRLTDDAPTVQKFQWNASNQTSTRFSILPLIVGKLRDG